MKPQLYMALTLAYFLPIGAFTLASRPAYASSQKWQVLTTPNFRILHLGSTNAAKIATLVENTRARSYLRLAEELPERTWSPRCDIYLYPNQTDLYRMTGRISGNIGSALSRPSRLSRGQILSRRINLSADDSNLIASTLPHEITHVVLKELFGGNSIPLWANEGLAVMAEGASHQGRYAAYIWRKVRAQEVFALADLMAMGTYPETPHTHLFYGQSSSLVHFFLNLGDPQQFITFLQLAPKNGLEAQLQASYGISELAVLQREWITFAKMVGQWASRHQ